MVRHRIERRDDICCYSFVSAADCCVREILGFGLIERLRLRQLICFRSQSKWKKWNGVVIECS